MPKDDFSTMQGLAVEVLRHGPVARRHLASRLGLSAGSLTRLSKPLLQHGLMVESASAADPETRRPARRLDIAAGKHLAVGVNLTGERAYGVLTDLRASVLDDRTVDLPARSPDAVVRTVAELVRDLAGTRRLACVGVSLGGFVDRAGRVVRAPFLGWDDPVDLAADLERALAAGAGLELEHEVVAGNDLAALTRAEHWFGEGRGEETFAVVTVGAGVGYGLVLHDRIVESPATDLQLLGHHPLVDGGPRCSEGHRGCATAVLTTSALAAAGSVALARPVPATELLDLAGDGHHAARTVVDDAARALGRLLAAVANFTTVERILLEGEGVGLATVGRDAMHAQLRSERDPLAPDVEVVVREHDRSVWARGAAGMAVQALVSDPRWLALAGVHGDRVDHHAAATEASP